METCYTHTATITSRQPGSMTSCLKALADELGKEARVLYEAVWLLAALGDCLVKAVPRSPTPPTRLSELPLGIIPAVAVELTVSCRDAESLVASVEKIMRIIRGKCSDVLITPHP